MADIGGGIQQMENSMEERVRLLEARLQSLDRRSYDSTTTRPIPQQGSLSATVSNLGNGIDAHVSALDSCVDHVLELLLPHVDAILTELEERIPILQALSDWSPLSENIHTPSPSPALQKEKAAKRKNRHRSGHFMSNSSTAPTTTNTQSCSSQTSTSQKSTRISRKASAKSASATDDSSRIHDDVNEELSNAYIHELILREINELSLSPRNSSSPDFSTIQDVSQRSTSTANNNDSSASNTPKYGSELQEINEPSPFAQSANRPTNRVPLQPESTSSFVSAPRPLNSSVSRINNLDFSNITVPPVDSTQPSTIPEAPSSSGTRHSSDYDSPRTRVPTEQTLRTASTSIGANSIRLSLSSQVRTSQLVNLPTTSQSSTPPTATSTSDDLEPLLSSDSDSSGADDSMKERFKVGAMLGNISYIREGLDAGVDINTRDDEGQTALHWAAWNGHEDIVQLLVRRGADLELRNRYGLNPLHMAARGGSAQSVAFLADAKADLNARCSERKTAMHFAALKGNEAVVLVLIASGADKDLVDSDWNTAYDLASNDAIRKLLQPTRNVGNYQ